MIGRSVFDFYYAEDLPYLKDVYTNGKWKPIIQTLHYNVIYMYSKAFAKYVREETL